MDYENKVLAIIKVRFIKYPATVDNMMVAWPCIIKRFFRISTAVVSEAGAWLFDKARRG